MIYRQRFPFHKLFLTDMENRIYREMAATPQSRLGVGSGWSGPKTLLELRPFDKLADFVLCCLPTALGSFQDQGYPPALRLGDGEKYRWPDFEVCGWGNVMNSLDETKRHDHKVSHLGGPNFLAGVYYLIVPPEAPPIVFDIPGKPNPYRFIPVAGYLILFPPDLVHHVPTNLSDFDRVSVGLNIRKAKYD